MFNIVYQYVYRHDFNLRTKDLWWILNCSYNYHYAWEHGTVYGFMAQYITQWNIIIIYLHLLSCSSICHSWILSSCACFQRTEILWSRCSLCLNTVQLVVWCVAHWAATHSHTRTPSGSGLWHAVRQLQFIVDASFIDNTINTFAVLWTITQYIMQCIHIDL